MNLTTESEATSLYIFVSVTVPVDFDRENEDHEEALEDALGPYGGTSMADIDRVAPDLIIARVERIEFDR